VVDARVLETLENAVRSNVLVLSVSGTLYLSDPVRLQAHPEYVYSGRSSFSAADYLSALGWRPPSGNAGAPRRLLDLGCGSGFAAVAAGAAGSSTW
jgi:hypothetical protein